MLAGVSVGLKLGPYFIQKPIGKGGVGTVYLANDSRTGLPAAIKVLSPKRVQEGQRHLARFRREMVLSQKLQHPNVALTKTRRSARRSLSRPGVHSWSDAPPFDRPMDRWRPREPPVYLPRSARPSSTLTAKVSSTVT